MLHLVYIDFIYIMCISWKFSDSITFLQFVYKNSVKNNFTSLINFLEIFVHAIPTKRINCRNQTELLAETATNLKQEL